ncbi:sulfite exporter TauE/SafE family protein [Chloroflexota bacterium]
MAIAHVMILLATGAGVGFIGSMLGIGGAFIITPIQYMVYTSMNIPSDVAIKLAFGTSLLVVLSTSISGTFRHYRKGAIWWKTAIIMGICSLIGSFGGATIASYLPGEVLKIIFAIVIMLSGIGMLIIRHPSVEEKARENIWLWVVWAIPIGFIGGLLGIGGGILVVPVMTLALRFKMHNAVATSLAMMIFTSTGGIIGYIINGIGVADLPAYSIGYVNLQSWFLLAITGIVMAQLGAITAHHLPAKYLRYIFIAIMFYVALKMLGIFEMLGWPI